ncbi:MAG: hypothetical protein ACI8S6_001986 [Myxococcota bacterium]|jgi:hypothetical protein
MELDHIFVFVSDGAAAERAAVAAGLVPTHRRRHRGQGAENVCFRFGDIFVELLWACDQDELVSAAVAPTGLLERSRWRAGGVCPFGVCVRTSQRQPPFETWPYSVPFPAGMSVAMASTSRRATEPLVFAVVALDAPEPHLELVFKAVGAPETIEVPEGLLTIRGV